MAWLTILGSVACATPVVIVFFVAFGNTILRKVVSKYLKNTICLRIYCGGFSLSQLDLQETALKLMDEAMPIPLQGKKVFIQLIKLKIPLIANLMKSKDVQSRKIVLTIQGIQLQSYITTLNEWGNEEYWEKQVQKLLQDKLTQANVLTTFLETEMQRFIQATGIAKKPQPDKKQLWIDQILNNVEIEIKDVSIECIKTNTQQQQEEASSIGSMGSIGLALKRLSLDSKPHFNDKEDLCLRQVELSGFNLFVNSAELSKKRTQIVEIGTLQANIQHPHVLQTLLVPLPLAEKNVQVELTLQKSTIKCVGDAILQLGQILEPFTVYSSRKVGMQMEADLTCVPLAVDLREKYIQSFTMKDLQNSERMVLEKKSSLDEILYLRMKALKWDQPLANYFGLQPQEIGVPEIMLFIKDVQDIKAPLRHLSLNCHIKALQVIMIDAGSSIDHTVASLVLEGVDTQTQLSLGQEYYQQHRQTNRVKNEEKDDITLGVALTLSKLNCTYFDVDHGPINLIDNQAQLLSLEMTQKRCGALGLKTTMESPMVTVLSKPLEDILNFLLRLVPPKSPDAAYHYEAIGLDDDLEKKELSSDLDPSSSTDEGFLKGQTMDLYVELKDLQLCLGLIHSKSANPQSSSSSSSSTTTTTISPYKKESCMIKQLLLLETSCFIQVKSDRNSEEIQCSFPNLSFLPVHVNVKETGHILVTRSTLRPILSPTSIAIKYDLHEKNHRNVDLKISAVLFAISNESLAFLITSLAEISDIPNHLVKKTEDDDQFEKEMERKKSEAFLAKQIAEFQRLFKEIDTDGNETIDRNEMRTLLSQTKIGQSLLTSELIIYVDEIFSMVKNDQDVDKDGMDFDDFVRIFAEQRKSIPLNGYLEMRCGEFSNVYSSELEEELFWQLMQDEAGVTFSDKNGLNLNNQQPLIVQKKMIRLFKNYSYAKKCWNEYITKQLPSTEWEIVKEDMCGGLACMDTSNINVSSMTTTAPSTKQMAIRADEDSHAEMTFKVTTTFGDISIKIIDYALSKNSDRAELTIQNIVLGGMVSIFQEVPYWEAFFGMEIYGRCYNTISTSMEYLIEPWDVVMACTRKKGEVGCTVQLEADKRFQVFITTSFMQTLELILRLVESPEDLQVNEEGFHVHNKTGRDLYLEMNDQKKQIFDGEIQKWELKDLKKQISVGINLPECEEIHNLIPERLFSSCLRMHYPASSQNHSSNSTPSSSTESSNRRSSKQYGGGGGGGGGGSMIDYHNDDPSSLSVCTSIKTIGDATFFMTLSSNVLLINSTSIRREFRIEVDGIARRSVQLQPDESFSLPVDIHQFPCNLHLMLNDEVEQTISLHPSMFTPPTDRRKGIVTAPPRSDVACHVSELSSNVLLKGYEKLNSLNYTTFVQWKIVLSPDFSILNILPYDIQYEWATCEEGKLQGLFLNEEKLNKGVVKAGESQEICLLGNNQTLYFHFCLLNEEGARSSWSEIFEIPIHLKLSATMPINKKITIPNGITIITEQTSTNESARTLRLSAPLWIKNNTGMELDYFLPKSMLSETNKPIPLNSQFQSPVLMDPSSGKLSIRVKGEEKWSSSLNVTAVGTGGEVSCGNHLFGISIHGLDGAFSGIKLVKLQPRYVIENRTSYTLKYRTYTRVLHSSSYSDGGGGGGSSRPVIPTGVLGVGESCHVTRFVDNVGDGKSRKLLGFCVQEKEAEKVAEKEAEKERWSSDIAVDTVGDSFAQLFSSTKLQSYIFCLSVQEVENTIFLVMSDSTKTPPYMIENRLIELPVAFKQKGSPSGHMLEPRSWTSFAWKDALSTAEKDLVLEIGGKTLDVYIDKVGKLPNPLVVEIDHQPYRIHVEVAVNGVTRVLRLSKVLQDDDDKKQQQQQQDNEEVEATQNLSKDVAKASMFFCSFIDIRFSGFGISLVDMSPSEAFYASIDVVTLRKELNTMQWEFSVSHFQIDNMLKKQQYAVILEPLGAGYNTEVSHGDLGKVKPSLQLKVTSAMMPGIYAFSWFEMFIAPLAIKLDIDYLLDILNMLQCSLPSEEVDVQVLNQPSLLLLKQPMSRPKDLRSGNLCFFEILRLHPILLEVEWSVKQRMLTASGVTRISSLVNQLLGLIGSNFRASPKFSFNELTINNCFGYQDRLTSQIVKHYATQGVMQAYRILGSSDLLGDPIGLVGNLGSGVVEFFRLTKGEMMGDSGTRGEGVKVLGKSLVMSTATTAAKITGSVDRLLSGVGGVCGDDDDHKQQGGHHRNNNGHNTTSNYNNHEYLTSDEEEEHTSVSKDLGKGAASGGKTFVRGLTGLVTKPLEGARKGGVTGLVQGTLQGVAGLPVNTLRAITTATTQAALGVEASMVDRSPYQGRARAPRRFSTRGTLISGCESLVNPSILNLYMDGAEGLGPVSSCDAFCTVYIDKRKVFQTKTIHNTVNPNWGERSNIALHDKDENVIFVVSDSFAAVMDSVIGSVSIPIRTIIEDFSPDKKISPLKNFVYDQRKSCSDDTDGGAISKTSSSTTTTTTTTTIGQGVGSVGNDTSTFPKRNDAMDFKRSVLVTNRTEKNSHRQILVTVLQAKDLVPPSGFVSMLSTSKVDAYFTISFGDLYQKTSCKMDTANPQFGEAFTFDLKQFSDGQYPPFKIKCYNKNKIKDSLIGKAQVQVSTLKSLEEASHANQNVPLYDDSKKVVGTVQIHLRPMGSDSSMDKMTAGVLRWYASYK